MGNVFLPALIKQAEICENLFFLEMVGRQLRTTSADAQRRPFDDRSAFHLGHPAAHPGLNVAVRPQNIVNWKSRTLWITQSPHHHHPQKIEHPSE